MISSVRAMCAVSAASDVVPAALGWTRGGHVYSFVTVLIALVACAEYQNTHLERT